MTFHLVTFIYDFMCQMLCNTHLTRPNKIKSNQSSPVHQQKHWRSVNDALASCWRSLAMVGVALTTDWRRFIHWRPLARLGDFFEHSKKIAKLDEALTTADERWRCDGNVLTLSGVALAMCPKLLVASASPDVASWCERGLSIAVNKNSSSKFN